MKYYSINDPCQMIQEYFILYQPGYYVLDFQSLGLHGHQFRAFVPTIYQGWPLLHTVHRILLTH